ncbi:MAG: ABC transporter permease, partial [Brevefilum sp.]
IGVPIGLISGFYGGWIDTFIQRGIDILYAFPSLLFIIVVMTFLQSKLNSVNSGVFQVIANLNELTGGLLGVLLSLGLVFWLTVSRLVRGETLSIKETEFVLAAEVLGTKKIQIMIRHILPNIVAPIVVAFTFGIPNAIMIEAGLSFLGLGIKPPVPSWGTMIAEGVTNIRSYPHLILSSGILLSLTLLAFNFLGDGLRDALDPSQRGKN